MKSYIFIFLIVGTANCLPAARPRKILDPALYLIPHPPLIATSQEKQQENTWVIPLVPASSMESDKDNGNEPEIHIKTSSGSEQNKEVNIQSLGTGVMFQGMKVQAFLKPYQGPSIVEDISYHEVSKAPTSVIHKTNEKHIPEKENVDKKTEEVKENKEKFGSIVEENFPKAEELKTAETFWSSPNYGYAGSNYGRYASGYLGYGNAYGGYSSKPAWTGGWGNGRWGHYGSG